ncbi:MAG: LCP family protein [Acidimicrobiales bacterium]|jgi:LCP family protein required for cell wall assembly
MAADDTWSRLRELERNLDGGVRPQPGLQPNAPFKVASQGGAEVVARPDSGSGSDSEPEKRVRRSVRSRKPEQAPAEPVAPGAQGAKRGWAARLVRLIVVLLILLIVVGVVGFLYGRSKLNQIERVEVGDVLAPVPGGGPTWLVVGSDSREGIDPDRPDAGGLLGEVIPGQRADAIILVRDVPGLGVQMLSLPRDLWFDPPGDNNATRINGAYNQGATELIRLIDRELGIEVHRFAEIDLAGLDSVVDAVGGVTIEIPNPGYDASLGLRLDNAGPVELDGATALAYVRTRKWTEIIDGVEHFDGTGDLGRTQRQQAFLSALGSKVGEMRNPFALNEAASGIADAVRIDGEAGIGDLYRFAQMLRSAQPATQVPVVGHVTGGGAHVLLLGDGADEVLALFR